MAKMKKRTESLLFKKFAQINFSYEEKSSYSDDDLMAIEAVIPIFKTCKFVFIFIFNV
jgi:hypothetical protein